jgi:ribosomal protein S18 acetylase RimI-like enzyme
MRVRQFEMSDFESVTRLWQCRRLPLGPLETRAALETKLQRDADLFLVAEENNVVLAAAVGSWDGRRGYVCNLAVDPLFERMGIGTQLLHEVERRLAARGATLLALHVPRDNVIAQEFFREEGFAPAPEQLLMLKPVVP